MTISEINRIETAIFAYKWKFSLLPTLFDRFFSLRSDTHSRQTRSAQTFNLIKCRTETRKRSLAFRAAALLNRIYELNVITFSTIIKSGMDPKVIRCGRPSGGLAISTKESSKLSLFLIACSDEYEEVLAEIESIVDMQNDIDNVLVAGDLNTDISRDNSAHTLLLLDFCDRLDL
ncbi:hypothetical protein CAPTEDRAFT_185936 [Capitella teleta]|uniref:Endonuclease/exonuclease/phosphatase domain-containing protein n=1 Tax=Capitella teleta TaxID=283909 RepID=R7UL71_CAPTE|nr:hypothetical protein CAPTEDRAFT_185936 [Capitella teleta]|eukprot:ELU07289.1 hypothetical protein CAPTEDRAFT_185936 [Capitella teleta]